MSETKSVNKLNERLGSLIEAIKVCFFFFIYMYIKMMISNFTNTTIHIRYRIERKTTTRSSWKSESRRRSWYVCVYVLVRINKYDLYVSIQIYDVQSLLKKVGDVKMSTIVSDIRTNSSFVETHKKTLSQR